MADPGSVAALQVVDLAVPFGEHPGLTAVDLSVGAGERLVIVGPSGAGKTTLLRAIAGLAAVTRGRIDVAGHDVTALPAERRDAVYVHQTPVLFPHLSVFENIAFPLRVRHRPAREVVARVAEMLAVVQLGDLAGRAPHTLSGGQRHRVALARAMAARPAVLLLDEPLASIDPALREEVRQAVLDLQRVDRPGLVLVTHDFDEAGLVADQMAVLLERTLAPARPPGELFRQPPSVAVARFLGFPNEIQGRVTADGMFVSPLGCIGPVRGLGPGPAIAVCRADAVRIAAEGAPVRIVSVRHRAQWTTVVGELVAAPSSLQVELVVGASAVPAVGTVVPVQLDPLAASFFRLPA